MDNTAGYLIKGELKPFLNGYELNISHTRGYAVLMLSEKERVAVDIEQRSDRVKRIASRLSVDTLPKIVSTCSYK